MISTQIYYLALDYTFHTSEMAEETNPIDVRQDYTRLMKCIADLHALVLPLVEPQEARPSKRTRTGLSVEVVRRGDFGGGSSP